MKPKKKSQVLILKEQVRRLRERISEMEAGETELRISLEALRESEAVFRSIVTTAINGVVAVDEKGNIILFNPAAEVIFGYDAEEIIGSNISLLIPEPHSQKHQSYLETAFNPEKKKPPPSYMEVEGVNREGEKIPLEITISRMALGYRTIFTAIVKDISERLQAQNERENLIAELKEALANVKTLKGLIPICACCKKVRNDEGFWQQVESYISSRSDADFSHSFCPDCMKKLYPKYFDKIMEEDKVLPI